MEGWKNVYVNDKGFTLSPMSTRAIEVPVVPTDDKSIERAVEAVGLGLGGESPYADPQEIVETVVEALKEWRL